MRLEVVNQTGRPFPRARLRRVTRQASRVLRLPRNAAVTVSLVTDRKMRRLNQRTRKVDRPTDVLAFPLYQASTWRRAQIDPEGALRLGDVVVSLDTARRQAGMRGVPLREEVALLCAHGLLHILGYDHRTRRAEKRMTELVGRLTL